MDEIRFRIARDIITQAAKKLQQNLNNAAVTYSTKTKHDDIVTSLDEETEIFIRQQIKENFSSDNICGEEIENNPSGEAESGTWYIDPIDGTANFVNKGKDFAISLGYEENGHIKFGFVCDVASQKLYHAQKGHGAFCNDIQISSSARVAIDEMFFNTPMVTYAFLIQKDYCKSLVNLAKDVRAVRSLGSVALEMCLVASGEADIFVAIKSSPWDHNAARLIVTEAGGDVSTLQGKFVPINAASEVLACNSLITRNLILNNYFGKGI